jgi:hypothetical protein
MGAFLCVAIVLFFLALGAIVFVVCGLIPPLRRFSLSAALWCAVWGPCSIAWLMLTGLILVANGFAMSTAQSRHLPLPEVPRQLWTGYGIAGLLGVALVATVISLVHQWLMHRMTFSLFRLYAGLVSAGVGSVWGWGLWIWLVLDLRARYGIALAGLGMVFLSATFGYAGWHRASNLRGNSPTRFPLVTPEEFEGIT